MDYKFSNTKRKKFKKWLLGGNSKIYMIILVTALVAVIFALYSLKTAGSIKTDIPETIPETEENEYVFESDSYSIQINKAANFITIYKLNSDKEYKAYKTFRCSVNSNVATGQVKITDKQTWWQFDPDVYGRFVSVLSNTVCIHSVPYTEENPLKLNASAYNRLGSGANIGSVYLQTDAAKWIYENCSKNTPVNIYENAYETPLFELPLFTPVASGAKYDPTDTEIAQNASENKIGGMTGITNVSLKLNQKFDKWEGVNAIDVTGKDITSLITISGNLDTSKPGNYTLSYQVVDKYGNALVKTRYITVSK